MKETDIINSIKYHIVYQFSEGQYWRVDQILSHIFATIFPFISCKVEFESLRGTIEPAFNLLSKFIKKHHDKSSLDALTFDGLRDYFEENLTSSIAFSQKCLLVKNAVTIVNDINTDGFVSLKVNDNGCKNIIELYAQYAVDKTLYGEQSYLLSSNQEQSEASEHLFEAETKRDLPVLTGNDRPSPRKTTSQKSHRCDKSIDKTVSSEEDCLKSFWRQQIVEKHPNFMNFMPYVWKLALPYSTYCDLKSKLQDCLKNLQGRAKTAFVKKHSLKLFIYIAEWYKWEYTSRNKNALGEFEIEGNDITQITTQLWTSYPDWKDLYLYAQRNQRWIDSIYVLGGFPLNQIHNDNRFDGIFEIIAKEEWKNNIENIIPIYREVDDTIAAKQSLNRNNGGLRRYIEVLTEEPKSIYAEEDQSNNRLVKYLFDRLNNGRRNSYKNLIKSSCFFYTVPGDEDCTYSSITQIGYKNAHRTSLPGDFFNSFGSDNYQDCYIGCDENHKIRYTKCGHKYIAWGGTNRIKQASKYIPGEVQNVYVWDIAGGDKIVLRSFKIGNEYIELFATGNVFEWTTIKDKKAQKAVLLPSDRYEVISDCNREYKTIEDKEYIWCDIHTSITFKDKEDNDREITLYNNGEVLLNIPLQKGLFRYHNHETRSIRYVRNEEEMVLPLLYGYPSGRVLILQSKGSSNPLQKKMDEITAEYLQYRQSRIFAKGSMPCFGCIGLKLKAKIDDDVYEAPSKEYFYIPNGFVRRDLENQKIIFELQADGLRISYLQNGDLVSIEPKSAGRWIYSDDGEYRNEDTVTFRIVWNNPGEYVELDVYRPINYRELTFNGELVERLDGNHTDRFQLPYILRDKFSLRIFGEDGVVYPQIPTNTIFINNYFDHCRQLGSQNQQEHFSLYMYTRNNRIKIDSNEIEQYNFYYWDVSCKNNPEKLVIRYDESQCEFIIPDDKLNNGGIIFQSLKDCTTRYYIKPMYGANVGWNALTNRIYNYDLFIKCYQVAIEHKIPFSQFYPLHKLVNKQEWTIKLLKNIIENKQYKLSKQDCRDLHRFANEFLFEWILIPNVMRLRFDKKYGESIKKLLKESLFATNYNDWYYLDRFVDCYKKIDLRGRTSEVACILNYIKGTNSILPVNDVTTNIRVLETLHKTQGIIYKLYKVFE